MKFIHTADWQLAMTRHFLRGEAQARFSQARIDAVRRIGQLAVEEGCEFVVVCGDVFESNQIDRQVLARAFEAMAATPSVTFYLLPGNHDPLDAASIYRSPTFAARKPRNVEVLDEPSPVSVADGIELVPAPWTSKAPLRDLVDQACVGLAPSGVTRIVVGHGALDTRSPESDNPALISCSRLEERIAAGEIHYAALGDRHSTTDEGDSGRALTALRDKRETAAPALDAADRRAQETRVERDNARDARDAAIYADKLAGSDRDHLRRTTSLSAMPRNS